MNFDATNFGMRIQEVRLRRGITQEQLAGEIDMARENLSRVECGARACSLEYLIRIAIALDVSTDYLLLGKETDKDRLRESLSTLMEQMSRFAQNL